MVYLYVSDMKLLSCVIMFESLASSDLSLDKHVSSVTATCFYFLRQLRRVRRSLDIDSTKTLVHAFIMSRLDYCNAVLAGSPQYITDTFQRVLNAAARFVSGTRNFDQGLSRLLFCMINCTGLITLNECSTSWQ